MYPFFGTNVDRLVWHRKAADRLRGCLNCLVGFLFFLIIVASLGALAVAKTGLVEVPFFSRFYSEPRPARVVEPSEKHFSVVLADQLAALARESGSLPEEVELRFTEAELTRGLRDALGGWGGNGLMAKEAQMAIFEGYAELYALLDDGRRSAIIRLEIIPDLEAEPLPARLQKVRIGQIPLWHRLAQFVLMSAIKTQLRDSAGSPFGDIEIEEIKLSEGILQLKAPVLPEL